MSEAVSQPQGTSRYLVSDLVGLALRQIGVGAMGTVASDQDLADGVMHLNMLLAKWQQEKFIVPNLVDICVLSTGASIYYIGPGANFDVGQRPARIEAAYARLANGANFRTSQSGDFLALDFSQDFLVNDDGLVGAGPSGPLDYPLALIASYEEYSAISLKGLQTWPSALFYSPAYPYGELRFWPIPKAGLWELHLVVKQSLQSSLAAETPLSLPPEYHDLLMWTLAARLAPSYGQEASPTVVQMAKSAMSTIRSANQQIPRVQMPALLGSKGVAASNPWWIFTGGF